MHTWTKGLAVSAALSLVVIAGSEATARVASRHLPSPVRWGQVTVQQKYDQLTAVGHADVVFLGSSLVDHGMDPALVTAPLGMSGYNAGIGGMPARTFTAWGQEVVIPRLKPSVVVIGISARDCNDNGLNQRGDDQSYRQSAGRRTIIGKASAALKVENFFDRTSRLVAYREYLRNPMNLINAIRGRRISSGPDKFAKDGWNTSLSLVSHHQLDHRMIVAERTTLNSFAAGGQDLRSVGDFASWLRSRGIKVVLVSMPLYRPQVSKLLAHGDSDLASFDAAASAMAARVGLPLLRPSFTDPSLFADEYHLNISGVKLIAPLVRDAISKALAS